MNPFQNLIENVSTSLHRLVMRLLTILKGYRLQIQKALSEGSRIVRLVFPKISIPQANSFNITRIAMTMLFLLVAAIYGFGQVVDPGEIDISTAEGLFGSIEAIFGLVIIIGGYLSAFIPGLKEINDGTLRVLVWAFVTGIGFIQFDAASVLSLSVTYAISTSLYEVVLQWFKKSPKPDNSGEDVA